MKLLTLSSMSTNNVYTDELRRLEVQMEDMQRQLDDQNKEIFNLKWELSSLRLYLNEDQRWANEHALLNDVILRKLAYFFSKKDLLNCRLVCRRWNNAVLPRIRREFYFHFKQHYGWLLIYLLIYAVLLMPQILLGNNKKQT